MAIRRVESKFMFPPSETLPTKEETKTWISENATLIQQALHGGSLEISPDGLALSITRDHPNGDLIHTSFNFRREHLPKDTIVHVSVSYGRIGGFRGFLDSGRSSGFPNDFKYLGVIPGGHGVRLGWSRDESVRFFILDSSGDINPSSI